VGPGSLNDGLDGRQTVLPPCVTCLHQSRHNSLAAEYLTELRVAQAAFELMQVRTTCNRNCSLLSVVFGRQI